MTSKRKHITLSIQEKIEIIKYLDEGSTVTSLSKKYNVGKSTICDIKKNKRDILFYGITTASGSNKRKTLKLSAFPEVDKAVYFWFLQQRSKGVPVCGEALCEKALFFYHQTHNDDKFKASTGWLDKFKTRYGIQQSSMAGDKLSSSEAAVEQFKNVLQNKIVEMHFQNAVSSDEEVEVLAENIMHKEAVTCFETCLKWAKENNESEEHILILSEMKRRAENAQEANIKQCKST